jgi:hypothetical protein
VDPKSGHDGPLVVERDTSWNWLLSCLFTVDALIAAARSKNAKTFS